MKLFFDVSPAFYKTLMFNNLSKKEDILVVYRDNINRPFRGKDFLSEEKHFKNYTLSGNMFHVSLGIIKMILKNRYNELIVGGYDSIYPWLAVLLSPRKKNGCIVESTYRETRKGGVRAYAKRLFFKHISKAYVCGKSHSDLVKAFHFKGKIVDIGTVGFIRRIPQPPFEKRNSVKRFLYVGRLTRVKNLEWLIERFSKHPELDLTIVGAGELEEKLKSISTTNIHFTGPVPNAELSKYYQEADVFVLPSLLEPFGLVVEEALNNGTPVLLSHMIGCQDNLVAAKNVGLVFQLNDVNDFEHKLNQICDINLYNNLRRNISKLDFEQFEEDMANAFVGE